MNDLTFPGDRCVVSEGAAPWYILRAATRQEKRACESLTELKIEHYMPMETVKRKLGRKEEPHDRALFPGYLFAQISDAMFHVAINADGVHAPVRKTNAAGERVPCSIPSGLVDVLREAQANGDFDHTKVPPMGVGDSVRITEGPFEGRVGEIIKMKSGERIKLLLEGYGKTTVSSDIVEIAA